MQETISSKDPPLFKLIPWYDIPLGGYFLWLGTVCQRITQNAIVIFNYLFTNSMVYLFHDTKDVYHFITPEGLDIILVTGNATSILIKRNELEYG